MAAVQSEQSGQWSFDGLKAKFDEWLSQQPPAVEVITAGLFASLQGAAIGYLLGKLTSMDPNAANPNVAANMNPQLQALQGGPLAQARNLGVFTGVNAALNVAIKQARGGLDDVWGAMAASFGAGMCYSLVSGVPNPLASAVSTGAAFALFNGLFYQIGNWFKPAHPDTDYDRSKVLFEQIGMDRFHENLKKGELTDNTILLWNDDALREVNIPAGPRLIILNHLQQYYHHSASSVLKPAVPVAGYAGATSWPTPTAAAAAPASKQ